MAIIEKLSPIKRKFFEELGIFKDEDIPLTFFDTIKSYSEDFSEAEKFCINDYYIAYCAQTTFSVKDIVGTKHNRYANKTWLEAFMDLDRGDETLELYYSNPEYYESIKQPNVGDILLAAKDGKYYILGGNNRMITMKIKYLALASHKDCNLEELNQQLSFCASTRVSPKEEVAHNIFYLIFPNGGWTSSKYQVLNKSTSINQPSFDIVTNFPVNPQTIIKGLSEDDIEKMNIRTPLSDTNKNK